MKGNFLSIFDVEIIGKDHLGFYQTKNYIPGTKRLENCLLITCYRGMRGRNGDIYLEFVENRYRSV